MEQQDHQEEVIEQKAVQKPKRRCQYYFPTFFHGYFEMSEFAILSKNDDYKGGYFGQRIEVPPRERTPLERQIEDQERARRVEVYAQRVRRYGRIGEHPLGYGYWIRHEDEPPPGYDEGLMVAAPYSPRWVCDNCGRKRRFRTRLGWVKDGTLTFCNRCK